MNDRRFLLYLAKCDLKIKILRLFFFIIVKFSFQKEKCQVFQISKFDYIYYF